MCMCEHVCVSYVCISYVCAHVPDGQDEQLHAQFYVCISPVVSCGQAGPSHLKDRQRDRQHKPYMTYMQPAAHHTIHAITKHTNSDFFRITSRENAMQCNHHHSPQKVRPEP